MSDELVRRAREVCDLDAAEPRDDMAVRVAIWHLRAALVNAEPLAARIEALEAQVREMAMQSLSDLGQAQDAWGAQKAAETALAAEREKVARLVEALRAHHRWHLEQDRDANAWGIDPVDAYSGSGLCEMTCAALASVQTGEKP